MLRQFGAAIISIITAIAILATAYVAKDTVYENAWLYVLAVGSVLASAFELYVKNREKNKR